MMAQTITFDIEEDSASLFTNNNPTTTVTVAVPKDKTTVEAALGAFTPDESDTTGKTYTGELTLTRTGTEEVEVTVTDVTLSEGTATITIDDAAAKEDVALTMTAKTTDKNGVVVASLKFDATKAAEAVAKAGTKEVKLGVELNTKNTKNVTSLFKKWFKNKNITAVKMAQKGEFGFTVEAAVKVDLKNFKKNNLKFYSYNAATNTYKEIETKYTIDAKGLVHFNTTVGNYIIITDAPIASK